MSRFTRERAERARIAAASKVTAPAIFVPYGAKVDTAEEAEKRRKEKMATKAFRAGGTDLHLHANPDDHNQRFDHGRAKAHLDSGIHVAAFLPKTTDDETLVDVCDYIAEIDPASVEDAMIEAIDEAREEEARKNGITLRDYDEDDIPYYEECYGASPGWHYNHREPRVRYTSPKYRKRAKNAYVRKTRVAEAGRNGVVIVTTIADVRPFKKVAHITRRSSRPCERKHPVTVMYGTVSDVVAHVRRTLKLGKPAKQHTHAA